MVGFVFERRNFLAFLLRVELMVDKLVSVICVNYYSGRLVWEIESLLSTCSFAQLIVVDNSGEFFPKLEATECIKSQGNIGFGRACNLGVEKAKGEFVLFLNPDASISVDGIAMLLNSAPKDGDNAIWGPVIIDASGAFSTLTKPGRLGLAYRRVALSLDSLPKNSFSAEYVSGACMMVKADYFRRLGGYSKDIFLYAEDLGLCTKVLEAGGSVYIDPQVRVSHLGGRSSAKVRDRLLRLLRSYNGHYCFLKKRMPMLASFFNALHLASGLRI